MKRRKFLGIFSLGVIGTAVGMLALPNFDEVVMNIIEHDTRELPIAEGAVEKYLSDAKKRNFHQRFNFGKREFIRGHYLIDNKIFTLPYLTKYSRYRSELVGNFLLSTNFFTEKMNTNKIISYTSFYDPYYRPCSNPFSNVYYS